MAKRTFHTLKMNCAKLAFEILFILSVILVTYKFYFNYGQLELQEILCVAVFVSVFVLHCFDISERAEKLVTNAANCKHIVNKKTAKWKVFAIVTTGLMILSVPSLMSDCVYTIDEVVIFSSIPNVWLTLFILKVTKIVSLVLCVMDKNVNNLRKDLLLYRKQKIIAVNLDAEKDILTNAVKNHYENCELLGQICNIYGFRLIILTIHFSIAVWYFMYDTYYDKLIGVLGNINILCYNIFFCEMCLICWYISKQVSM